MGGFPYRLAGSSGNTRVALMYAGSGAAHLTLTAMAVAKIVLGRVVAGRGNPWLIAAMISAGFILAQMADKEFMDRVRLVVRYSMWGKSMEEIWGENTGEKNRRKTPHKNEGALGPWWLLLDDDDSIGERVRPINVSKQWTIKDWEDQLMVLEAKNGDVIKIRETFERNTYLFNVAAQFPSTKLAPQAIDRYLDEIEVSHYAVNVSGLQDSITIESVCIKLISIPSEQVLHDKVYKYEPQGEELSLFPLLADGSNRRINSIDKVVSAEKLAIIFVDGNAQNTYRNYTPMDKHILISAERERGTRKRVEIDIVYAEGSRLPLRLEKVFDWAISSWNPNDLNNL